MAEPDPAAADRRAWADDEFEIDAHVGEDITFYSPPSPERSQLDDDELRIRGITRAVGHDVTPGHDELHHY